MSCSSFFVLLGLEASILGVLVLVVAITYLSRSFGAGSALRQFRGSPGAIRLGARFRTGRVRIQATLIPSMAGRSATPSTQSMLKSGSPQELASLISGFTPANFEHFAKEAMEICLRGPKPQVAAQVLADLEATPRVPGILKSLSG